MNKIYLKIFSGGSMEEDTDKTYYRLRKKCIEKSYVLPTMNTGADWKILKSMWVPFVNLYDNKNTTLYHLTKEIMKY